MTCLGQLGVQHPAHGHFDMRTGEAGGRTTALPGGGRPAAPPEPQSPINTSQQKGNLLVDDISFSWAHPIIWQMSVGWGVREQPFVSPSLLMLKCS